MTYQMLSDDVTGPVLLPDSREYEQECATYNLLSPLRPAAVLGAVDVADVQAGVRFAVSRGMSVAIRGAAHCVARPAEDALLISLRRMSRVTVDARSGTARLEGAVTWAEVIDATAPYGLAPAVGSTTTVSAIGYLLGGGQSPVLGRSHGYASDHITRIEVVTADGELREVTKDSEPDLFFALRGGKGNFGVVTAVEIGLFPVSRLVGGGLYFPGERLADVLHAWRQWVTGLPEHASSSLAVQRLPPAPELPEPLRGAFVVHVRFSSTDDLPGAPPLLAPLRAAAPVLLDTVRDMPFAEVGSIHADPPTPIPYVDRSTGLRELSKEGVDALLELVGPGSGSVLPHVEIRALGGALDREPAVADAVSTRGLAFQLFAFGVGGPEQAGMLRDELARLIDGVRPWADWRSMPNFLSPDEARTPAQVRTLYGPEVYDRLSAVKARLDPANVFRNNHNVAPADA